MTPFVLPAFLARQDTFQNRNVLVTGACGFLGSAVCAFLRALGARVVRIDPRLDKNFSANDSDCDLKLRVQDAQLREILAPLECDFIFHLAGAAFAAQSVLEPFDDFEANLYATVQFLETLRAIQFQGVLVYASSAAVYGEPLELPITEETRPAPISPYGVSKYASENYLNVYAALYNFHVVCARLFSLYGPGQRKQVVFDLIRKTLESKGPIQVLGDGSEMRDLTYVQDAAAALVVLAARPRGPTRIVNVCSGQATSVRTLAEKIVAQLGDDPSRISFTGARRPGDPVVWTASNARLLQSGFEYTTDLEQGLHQTIQWVQNEML
jgi:UDP-glucose 4-epimerase